jgi:uncharacterized membrane protein (DUF2068 family)
MFGAKATDRGLRGIAAFEAAKGLLVLAAGLGLLRYANGQVVELAEAAIEHLHFDPENPVAKALLRAVAPLDGVDGRWIAMAAGAYALVRFAEAYGLWTRAVWGEVVAVVSTGLYVPLELYEVFSAFTWLKAGITAANVAVLAFVLQAFRQQRAEKARAAQAGKI